MLYDNPKIHDYIAEMQYGSLQVCRAYGYHLLVNPCRADSPDLIRELIGLHRQVDGFIVLQPLSDLRSLNQLLLDNGIASGVPGYLYEDWGAVKQCLDDVFEDTILPGEEVDQARMDEAQACIDALLK